VQPIPVPIPGGDVLAPSQLFNQFFPGAGPIYDGRDADPHGITNFRGLVAMGYTLGTAKDFAGRNYNVITDVRVYQGAQNQPARTAPSSRYELISTTPV
jgi:hypothetical protein